MDTKERLARRALIEAEETAALARDAVKVAKALAYASDLAVIAAGNVLSELLDDGCEA